MQSQRRWIHNDFDEFQVFWSHHTCIVKGDSKKMWLAWLTGGWSRVGRPQRPQRFKKYLNCIPLDYKMEKVYKGEKPQNYFFFLNQKF